MEEAYAVRATNPLQCRSAYHAFKPEAASNTRGQRPSGSWATSQSGLADNSCEHKERNSSEGTANPLPGHDVRFFSPFLQSAFHPSFILLVRSVSGQYLALAEIYLPFHAAVPISTTRCMKSIVQAPPATGVSPSMPEQSRSFAS